MLIELGGRVCILLWEEGLESTELLGWGEGTLYILRSMFLSVSFKEGHDPKWHRVTDPSPTGSAGDFFYIHHGAPMASQKKTGRKIWHWKHDFVCVRIVTVFHSFVFSKFGGLREESESVGGAPFSFPALRERFQQHWPSTPHLQPFPKNATSVCGLGWEVGTLGSGPERACRRAVNLRFCGHNWATRQSSRWQGEQLLVVLATGFLFCVCPGRWAAGNNPLWTVHSLFWCLGLLVWCWIDFFLNSSCPI